MVQKINKFDYTKLTASALINIVEVIELHLRDAEEGGE